MTKISNQYSLTNVLFADAVNGRVGIGTSSPTVALDVVGAGKFSGSSTAAGLYLTTDNALQSVQATVSKHTVVGLTVRGSTANVFDFSLYSAGGTALMTNPTGTNNINFNSGQVWFNGGNVGIGTSSPGYKLSVVGPVLGNAISWTDNQNNTGFLGIRGTAASIGADNNLLFETAATERMRITAGGNVGIGTSSPSAKLHVEGAVLSSTSNWINTNIQIRRRGSVDGIEVTGDGTNGVFLLYGSNSWGSMSDERLKDINSLITDAIPSVMSLRAVKYSWKSDETKQSRVGLIAQDIQAILPEAVDINNDEFKTLSVKYTEVIPLLVAAIQEQQLQINELKALLNA